MVVGYSVGGGVTDMDPYHMLPAQDVQRIIAGLPEELQDIVLELRGLIVSAAPGATETCHRGGFTYDFAERGGPVSASLCQIIWLPEQIWLAFNHGAFLPDPRRLLTGPAKYKRSVRLLDATAHLPRAFSLGYTTLLFTLLHPLMWGVFSKLQTFDPANPVAFAPLGIIRWACRWPMPPFTCAPTACGWPSYHTACPTWATCRSSSL